MNRLERLRIIQRRRAVLTVCDQHLDGTCADPIRIEVAQGIKARIEADTAYVPTDREMRWARHNIRFCQCGRAAIVVVKMRGFCRVHRGEASALCTGAGDGIELLARGGRAFTYEPERNALEVEDEERAARERQRRRDAVRG